MITAIIIDDEEMGRVALYKKLANYCPEVEVLGKAKDGTGGLKLIETLKPDVVFLDIEMPGMDGFEMLNKLPQQDFHLIFTTAYDHYAIKAIRFAALDYLLKPIDVDELKQAVSRIAKLPNKDTKQKLEVLQQNLMPNNLIDKIAIPSLEGLLFLGTQDILHIEADGNYSTLYLADGNKQVVCRALKDFEDLLSSTMFFRCHHSHLINLKAIKRYIKSDGGLIELENGQTIPVSRRKKDDFLKKIRLL